MPGRITSLVIELNAWTVSWSARLLARPAPWMLWSRERETGFKSEIERTFRSRAQAAGNTDGSTNFTFANYGSLATPVSAAFGGSEKRIAAAMGAWLAPLPKPTRLSSKPGSRWSRGT